MGIDCGFDIRPRLKPTDKNIKTYQKFIQEIISTYEKVYDEKVIEGGGNDDGKVLKFPTGNDPYFRFLVGEWPDMPADPKYCNYFLRFSSKISGSCTHAIPYIDGVYNIAKHYFGSRVHYWEDLGYYGWEKVYNTRDELSELCKKNNSQKKVSESQEKTDNKVA